MNVSAVWKISQTQASSCRVSAELLFLDCLWETQATAFTNKYQEPGQEGQAHLEHSVMHPDLFLSSSSPITPFLNSLTISLAIGPYPQKLGPWDLGSLYPTFQESNTGKIDCFEVSSILSLCDTLPLLSKLSQVLPPTAFPRSNWQRKWQYI